MTIGEIARVVDGEIVCGAEHVDRGYTHAFAADLMSDVLARVDREVLFITGLASLQTVRTAMVADIDAVLVVRGKAIPSEMLRLAGDNGIVLIRSPYSMFRASGLLYAAGIAPLF